MNGLAQSPTTKDPTLRARLERGLAQAQAREATAAAIVALPERPGARAPTPARRGNERGYARSLDRPEQLAGELSLSHPGAAGSLREGMADHTLTRLGIGGPLKRTLASTNPFKAMIECARPTARNVNRWQSGEMALRWTAAGMLEAEGQFRRIIGYQQLAKLAVAIDREPVASAPTEEVAPRQCVVTARGRRRSSTTSGTSSAPVSSQEHISPPATSGGRLRGE